MGPTVETLTSADAAWKVEIVRRDDGNLQVLLFRWFEETGPDGAVLDRAWTPVKTAVTITDTLPSARRIAEALLRTHAGAG